MRFNVITLFPEMVEGGLSHGVVGEAIRQRVLDLELRNPRSFTEDRHKTIDDRPFGGGDGMVMLLDPILKSLQSLGERRGRIVGLTPHGRPWSDRAARQWAKEGGDWTLICGRYAGWDHRLGRVIDEEVSLGDFILSGGEIAAMAIVDSVVRHIPGVLGNSKSADEESFKDGLLEAPQFTRPENHPLGRVPRFLLSGNHAQIRKVRAAIAKLRTHQLRPDLLTGRANVEDFLGEAREELRDFTSEDFETLALIQGRSLNSKVSEV